MSSFYLFNSLNQMTSCQMVTDKLWTVLSGYSSEDECENNYLVAYTPPGSTPTPTPTMTFKFMQNGLDITNKVKEAIGSGSAMSIKTISSGSGTSIFAGNHEYEEGDPAIYAGFSDWSCIVEKDNVLIGFGPCDPDDDTILKFDRSTDGGVTWITSNLAKPDGFSDLSPSKAIITQNRIILIPRYRAEETGIWSNDDTDYPGSSFIYTDDLGLTWKTGLFPHSACWVGCYANNTLVISDLDVEPGGGTVYYSTNEGATWNTGADYCFRAIHYSAGKFIGFVDNGDEAHTCSYIRTSADGITWSDQISIGATGIPPRTKYCGSLSDDTYLYVIESYSSINNGKYILRSSDAGQSWTIFMDLKPTGIDYFYAAPFAIFNGELLFSLNQYGIIE